MPKPYKSTCYCTNLRRCANIAADFYDRELQASGLTVSQYYLLINLQRLENANITHWAAFVGLERSTMVRNIKVLDSRGFLERREGPGKTFALSKAGQTALEEAVPLWEAAQRQMELSLGEEDVQALLRIGAKLQDR